MIGYRFFQAGKINVGHLDNRKGVCLRICDESETREGMELGVNFMRGIEST